MATFQDAVVKLNRRNLGWLLRMCAYLSAIERVGFAADIAPLWNSEKQRLLCEAVLSSRAMTYKTECLTFDELVDVSNATHQAMDDPRLEQELQSGGERSELLYAARRFFARMANLQIRYQEPRLFMNTGRLVAMLDVLPRVELAAFPSEYRALATILPAESERVLGASIFQLLLVHLHVDAFYRRLADMSLTTVPKRPPTNDRSVFRQQQQMKTLKQLFSRFAEGGPIGAFSIDAFKKSLASILPDHAVDAYFRIFSGEVCVLRKLRRNPPYTIGPEGWRLSVLERYPVVCVNGQCTVPNLALFFRSFPDVIHFVLQENLGNRYNEFRGAAQEVYLRKLVEHRTSARCVIPERKYRRPTEVKGPDLTIIENPGPRLILVESKARRLLAMTRFTMSETSLDENYTPVYEALCKAPAKLADLRQRLPEYADVQADIDSTAGAQPILVAVTAEGPYMLNEQVRYRATRDSTHPLARLGFPFCVMDLELFDLAVEVAAHELKPLYDILGNFWEDSANLEASGPLPGSFRGATVRDRSTYGSSFLKPMFESVGIDWSEKGH